MKKKINILCFILVLALLILSGCKSNKPGEGGGGDPITPPEPEIKDVIEVTSLDSEIRLKDLEVMEYDFTSLFKITVNGEAIKIEESYIDKKDIKAEAGTYNVVCMYKGSSASISVVVIETIYEVNLTVDEINVNIKELKNYDFKSLFTCSIDGNMIEITDDMVETNLENAIGTYTYTVTNHNASKTLTINLIEVITIEIMNTYKTIEIEISNLKNFDFTTLFTIYKNGKYVPVTSDMIDKSSLENATINNEYPVTINYVHDDKTFTKVCKVKVVADDVETVSTKNVVTYPNGEIIDLRTLFEIKKGKQIIPITSDMISGFIDYTKVGNNEITLTYNGKTYVSIVEIKLGVIIDYKTSDTITILKGTNQANYPFINDFNVLINGIKFTNISSKYLDTSLVDFSKEGTYQATLKLPYNDHKVGLSGVKFDYIEKTINYVVVNNNYKITLDQEEVIIKKGETKFDPFKNIKVFINGKPQTLTDNPEYVDVITCYAKIISEPIRFDFVGLQTVKVEIYANGVNNAPEVVSYNVIVESDIEIITHDKTMFTNEELNPKDLFTIKNGKEIIPVTMDMLTGRLDPSTPGAYTITIEYLGIVKEARVVVFDEYIRGEYKTPLRTFKPKFNYGGGEDEYEEAFVSQPLGNLTVNDDGSMSLQGANLELIEGISESKFKVSYRNNDFMLYYHDGIIIMNPINEIRLSFNNTNRPYIYFNTNLWKMESYMTINLGNSYVLEEDYVTYSIDLFTIVNKKTNEKYTLGLKTDLVSRVQADSFYEVTWGEVTFIGDVNSNPGSINTFKLNDLTYKYIVKNNTKGKIYKEEVKPQYINKTFKGTFNGLDAELRTDQLERFTFICDNKSIFDMGPYELGNLLNGGVDYENNIVFIYDSVKYEFSYKFKVDPVNDTFELLEKDNYFGLYEGKNISVFLDGYGTGEINFDTKQYAKTKFMYNVNGNTIDITYLDVKANFNKGKTARFTIDQFLNVLTIKDFYDENLIDSRLLINKITDGAIVNIKSFQVGQGADKVAKQEFYNNIEIITKDGILSEAEKTKLIDTKKIRFSVPGFYEFSIKIEVNGVMVTNYYGVEVLESIYKDNIIVGSYGYGIMNKNISLSIDMYGRVIIISNQDTYNGNIKINEDNTFVINAENGDGLAVFGNGELVNDGTIRITCSGGLNFTDYFSFGTVKESGIKNFIIRNFNYNNVDTYILFDGTSAIGKIVDIELVDGTSINQVNSILKIMLDKDEWIIKVLSWTDTKEGLVFADDYRGTYLNDENKELVIDGFSNAIYNGMIGSYYCNKDIITININNTIYNFKLDLVNNKFSTYEVQMDESLVAGETFTASHTFFCHDAPYIAKTSFEFLENGVVNVISVSPDHDSGENQCTEDVYKPTFASTTGVKGTYTVKGNKIEVRVNKEIFVFEITNILNVNTIKCISTTLNELAHGYFEVNTLFKK